MPGIGIEILQLFKDPVAAKVFELFARLIGDMSSSMLTTVRKGKDSVSAWIQSNS